MRREKGFVGRVIERRDIFDNTPVRYRVHLADALKVRGYPTLVFVVDGEVKDTLLGASTKRELEEWIQQMMATLV